MCYLTILSVSVYFQLTKHCTGNKFIDGSQAVHQTDFPLSSGSSRLAAIWF